MAMNDVRKKRASRIALLLLGVALAASLALMGLSENINHYKSPTAIAMGEAKDIKRVRVGGWVKESSVRRPRTADGSLLTEFKLTDRYRCVSVKFNKVLPDLFREGDEAVAVGVLGADGILIADEVLAKHDENYVPPDVANYGEMAKQKIAAAGANHKDCDP
jgi:cytochrome c-type biogenesis protein CcmE